MSADAVERAAETQEDFVQPRGLIDNDDFEKTMHDQRFLVFIVDWVDTDLGLDGCKQFAVRISNKSTRN